VQYFTEKAVVNPAKCLLAVQKSAEKAVITAILRPPAVLIYILG